MAIYMFVVGEAGVFRCGLTLSGAEKYLWQGGGGVGNGEADTRKRMQCVPSTPLLLFCSSLLAVNCNVIRTTACVKRADITTCRTSSSSPRLSCSEQKWRQSGRVVMEDSWGTSPTSKIFMLYVPCWIFSGWCVVTIFWNVVRAEQVDSTRAAD